MYYKNIISKEKIIIVEDIHDFSVFDGIDSVEFDVGITYISDFEDLSFLKNIKSIGRNLHISDCKNLKSLNLENLEYVGGMVHLVGNPLLSDLRLNEKLEITDKIITDEHLLNFFKNAEVYDFDNFAGLGKMITPKYNVDYGTYPDGSIISFVDVDEKFENYNNLKFNIITKNAHFDGVDNFGFLETLTSVGNLTIKNSSITNLNFLRNLEFVENLEIVNCPNIVDFSELCNIKIYEYISINGKEFKK